MAGLTRRLAPLAILLSLLPPPARALAPFEAIYDVRNGGSTIGEARMVLSRSGTDGFLYESTTRATGLLALFLKGDIVESSRWRDLPSGPRPDTYLYRREGRPERGQSLQFDWQNGVVAGTQGGQPVRTTLPAGTLDRLLVQLALMRDLASGRERLEYRVADGAQIKTYVFNVVGTEDVETPAGRYRTVKAVRLKDGDGSPAAYTFWCAPDLGYLPVRVDKGNGDEDGLKLHLRRVTFTTGAADAAR